MKVMYSGSYPSARRLPIIHSPTVINKTTPTLGEGKETLEHISEYEQFNT